MTERDIIRRLQEEPVPPPPEDLAARIVDEIPDEVELHPELEQPSLRRTTFIRRPIWLAAAAAMAVAIMAGVNWQLRHQRPTTVIEATQEQDVHSIPALRVVPGEDAGEAEETNRQTEPSVDVDAEGGEGRRNQREKVGILRRYDPAPGVPQSESAGREEAPTPVPEPKTRRVAIADPTPNEPMPDPQAAAPQPKGKEGGKRDANKGKSLAQGSVVNGFVDGSGAQPEPRSKVTWESVERKRELDEASKKRRQMLGYIGDKDEAMARSVQEIPQPSTGGSAEPNDEPYGDVFFEHSGVNPFVDSEDDALSTFGLDVDTGSYTVTRRYLKDGNLPPASAIRVEEFVNAFDYGDPSPRRDDFRLAAEGAPSIFAPGEGYTTLRFAINAREVDAADRPAAVLVFCVDVSGSMNRENRLGLVKQALYELLANLRSDDRVGLVVYGSRGEVLLEPTIDHELIRRAISRLQSGGSTNAEEGLLLAYGLLDRFNDGPEDVGIRRVILCSDGVANVGRTGPESILERIKNQASEGIELTTVGFGMGNYNDRLMEQLANAGDGRYAYVDDLAEARRIFVEQLTGTLLTIGREAKAQVEFNPDVVSRWRLLGYENRDIADERFRDPTVDAGEIGAGHTVTALYEVKLKADSSRRDTVATLRMRYRPMGTDQPVEIEESIRIRDLENRWKNASPAFRLSSLVAEFAEVLKKTYWAKNVDLQEVERKLRELQDESRFGAQLDELIVMVSRAVVLQSPASVGETDMP